LKSGKSLFVLTDVLYEFRFLQATVTGIHASQPPTVRISAVRAVSEYCEHLRQNEMTHMLQPFIGDMVDGLLSVATQYSTDVIALCLETLCVVLEVRDLSDDLPVVVGPLHMSIMMQIMHFVYKVE
jgi:importin-9